MPECPNAKDVARLVETLLGNGGFATLREFVVPTGRRFDLIGLHTTGQIVGVEIKVSEADIRSDFKWPEYLEHCDAFFFAIGPQVRREFVPNETGLITTETGVARIVRPPMWRGMNEGRRAATILNYARTAMDRLRSLTKDIEHVSDRLEKATPRNPQ